MIILEMNCLGMKCTYINHFKDGHCVHSVKNYIVLKNLVKFTQMCMNGGIKTIRGDFYAKMDIPGIIFIQKMM